MLPGQNPFDLTPSPNRGMNAAQRRAARKAGLIPPTGCGPEQVRRAMLFKQALDSMQEEMDTLRLSVKYLVFDLEATRRERDHAAMCAEGMAAKVARQNQIIASLKRRLGQ